MAALQDKGNISLQVTENVSINWLCTVLTHTQTRSCNTSQQTAATTTRKWIKFYKERERRNKARKPVRWDLFKWFFVLWLVARLLALSLSLFERKVLFSAPSSCIYHIIFAETFREQRERIMHRERDFKESSPLNSLLRSVWAGPQKTQIFSRSLMMIKIGPKRKKKQVYMNEKCSARFIIVVVAAVESVDRYSPWLEFNDRRG